MDAVMLVSATLSKRSCHPERSEGSRNTHEILRFAQDDSFASSLVRGIFLAIILLFSPFTVYATGYDTYRWSASYYYGQTVSAPLIDVFILQWRRWPEHVQ